MKAIPKRIFDNAYNIRNVPMTDKIYGMHGTVALEGLHMFVNGVCETLISKQLT